MPGARRMCNSPSPPALSRTARRVRTFGKAEMSFRGQFVMCVADFSAADEGPDNSLQTVCLS